MERQKALTFLTVGVVNTGLQETTGEAHGENKVSLNCAWIMQAAERLYLEHVKSTVSLHTHYLSDFDYDSNINKMGNYLSVHSLINMALYTASLYLFISGVISK